jgi:hypothetical protein
MTERIKDRTGEAEDRLRNGAAYFDRWWSDPVWQLSREDLNRTAGERRRVTGDRAAVSGGRGSGGVAA